MIHKRLVLWVEGSAEIIFFQNIIKPLFEKHYDKIKINEYKGDQIKGEYVNNIVCKLIKAIEDPKYLSTPVGKFSPQNYIFFRDFDNCTCYTFKKKEICDIIPPINKQKIIIVKNIIESWYLAGISVKNCRKLGIPIKLKKNNSDIFHKNNFYNSIPKKHLEPKRNFLIKLTQIFDFEEALETNESFKYFVDKYLSV